MEPMTLAASAAALLTPYLVKAAGKAAEKVGEKVVEVMPLAAGRLWQAITTAFGGKPAAEEAVKDLAANPQDEDSVASFRIQLRKALEADDRFADELARLLGDAQHESGQTIINTGSGAVATSGGVAAGQGGIAIGGSVYGNLPPGGSDPKRCRWVCGGRLKAPGAAGAGRSTTIVRTSKPCVVAVSFHL